MELAVNFGESVCLIEDDKCWVQSVEWAIRTNSLNVSAVVVERHHLVCDGTASLEDARLVPHAATLCEDNLLRLLSLGGCHDDLSLTLWLVCQRVEVERCHEQCDATGER